MADTTVKVSFIGDAKKLKSTIDGVDKDIGSLGKSSKSFGSKFTDGFSKALPVLAGVGAGVAVLGSALKAAIEDEAEQKKLAQTLISVAGATSAQIAATEKWIDVTQRATGVADSDLRPAYDKLVRSSGSLEAAQKNLGIAMDVSRGTGKDLDTVAQALAKVLEGNTAAAARLVPELTGIAREGASADEVMAALATTFQGQTAAHANTTAGKLERMNAAFAEMKEKVGEKLLPEVIKFSDWLIEKAIPWIEKTAEKIDAWWKKQDGLRDAIESGGEKVKAFTETVITLVGWVVAGGEAIDNLAKKMNSLPDRFLGLRTGFPGNNMSREEAEAELKRITGKASGGPVRAGVPYVVGEKRPELFVPNVSGYIRPTVPSLALSGASPMGGGEVHHHYEIHVDGVINETEAARRIVSMLQRFQMERR